MREEPGGGNVVLQCSKVDPKVITVANGMVPAALRSDDLQGTRNGSRINVTGTHGVGDSFKPLLKLT
eukprot:scaffold1947_cov207-Prasinococcus_capsulatus_cf.AAC.22